MNLAIEKKIGKNIRKLRKNANLTQEMLSAKLQVEGCDITRSGLAKIEVGQRHLYPDEIIALRKILKTTYEELLNIEEQQKPPIRAVNFLSIHLPKLFSLLGFFKFEFFFVCFWLKRRNRLRLAVFINMNSNLIRYVYKPSFAVKRFGI